MTCRFHSYFSHIYKLYDIINRTEPDGSKTFIRLDVNNFKETGTYNSLEELNKDFEDYKLYCDQIKNIVDKIIPPVDLSKEEYAFFYFKQLEDEINQIDNKNIFFVNFHISNKFENNDRYSFSLIK